MGGYVQVDVSIDDVLDELSDDEIRREAESRKIGVGIKLTQEIEDAARSGRAWDLLAVVQDALGMNKSPCRSTPYDKLERDPVTGRPVIQ